ncbi:MAG TPA: glycosyltransferase family 4 protein [Burkholderiales bacterium]|nr:glycosyltransferase family 4 protein [Burkholderiales bacterium]
MHIAFYAPLKAPSHGTPSGDRRVASLFVEALQHAGHHVELVSSFRSYDGRGDATRQAALRVQGLEVARRLVAGWRDGPIAARPDLWFTYHVYYKAPDWLGPHASATLGVPYVIAEASYAPKRAGGAWSLGHESSREAVRQADLVVSPTRFDMVCLETLVAGRERIVLLPPFLDPQPFRAARLARDAHRARLATMHGIDAQVPWIVVAAMMRPGDKTASYRQLAEALARIADLRWQLVVAGDGTARSEVEAVLEAAAPGRSRLLGALSLNEIAAMYGAGDVCVWPAVNEAYGMAMLEAQAAGVPVVSCAERGVPDVVVDGRTGLLAPPGDMEALAQFARMLLLDPERRAAMGRAAAEFAAGERSLGAAAMRLDRALARVRAGAAAPNAATAN